MDNFVRSFDKKVSTDTATTPGYHNGANKKPDILTNNVHNNHRYSPDGTRTPVSYKPKYKKYSEDTGVQFPIKLPNGNFMMVNVVNDGHGGRNTSAWLTKYILENFQTCVYDASGVIVNRTRTTRMTNDPDYVPPTNKDAIDLLFERIDLDSRKPENSLQLMNSGSCCSIMVYDLENSKVYSAVLGDCTMMRFNIRDGVYKNTWVSDDQDAGSPHELLRLQLTYKNAASKVVDNPNMPDESDVRITLHGINRLRSYLMVTGAVGDHHHDKDTYTFIHNSTRHRVTVTGIINRKPNKYILDWEHDTIWVQGSDGLHEHNSLESNMLRARPEITTELYEKLFTRIIIEKNDTNNLAAEMITCQQNSCIDFIFRQDKARGLERNPDDNEIQRSKYYDWVNSNWDNHHQIVTYMKNFSIPSSSINRCSSVIFDTSTESIVGRSSSAPTIVC